MVSPDDCTELGNGWCFQKPIVAGQPVPPQLKTEGVIVMGSVEPELVSVAEPVTVQLSEIGVGQDPVVVWVSVFAAAVKMIAPVTGVAGSHESMKVKSTSYVV